MRFLLLHAVDGSVPLEPERAQGLGPSLAGWVEETLASGANLHGSLLQPERDATTVRVRGGELLVSDGPFAETKEQIAGYDLLECADLAEALELAGRHPTASIGSIEVRAVAGT